jgi:hypothetical protein
MMMFQPCRLVSSSVSAVLAKSDDNIEELEK